MNVRQSGKWKRKMMGKGGGREDVIRSTSLQRKLMFAFGIIIVLIMLITLLLHLRTVSAMRQISYDRMEATAEYYQQTFEKELQHILQLQLEFFSDRNLPFLADSSMALNDYEKRNALLSVKERLNSITGISSLVEDGVLYFPKSGYCITESNIVRMGEAEQTAMVNYLKHNDGMMHYDGENYYIIRTGEIQGGYTENPNYAFVLTFSSAQIEEMLRSLNAKSEGGAFIYNDLEGVMLEGSSGEAVGREILDRLKTEKDGSYTKRQQLRVNGKEYLAVVGDAIELGLFVQYMEISSVMRYVDQSWLYTGIFLVAMILMAVSFTVYTVRIIHRPMQELVRAFKRVQEGELDKHIYRNEKDEFAYLYHAFNEMEDRLKRLINEVYVQKNLAQRAQLKQMQAQINPHFLYNSFFILRRRIKRQDYENADEFAGHLANYFKYLARDGRDEIPLYQEVEHARSYAQIQGARFAGRVEIRFGRLPEEWREIQVPRLILQPLLENAFEHGLEDRMENGLLRVDFSEEDGELRIVVEDNGESISEETIEAMRLSLEQERQEEVTGVVNIHRRLHIRFRGCAGLRIERSALGGLSVCVWLKKDAGCGPAGEDKDEP